MDVVTQMKNFLEPRSVAIFGVSRRTGKEAFNILESLLSYGYQGKVYPINPNASEILGIKCYSSIREVPEQCDLAIINLPRQLVPQVVRECASNGIESVVIETQGFADADDDEGKQLQGELDEVIRGSKVRVLGPNSLGTGNAFANFSSSFARLEMERVPVGVICQTGVFMCGFFFLKLVGKGIDLGNGCDLDFADGLRYFEQDDDIKVVALHIEGIKDGRRFMEAANTITRKKPVVALKTGKSERAAQAAQSHTGSLVGKDEVWDVGLRQSGIIRVSDVDEFADVVKAFYTLPLMKGRRLGVVTYTGGVGIMCIDACQKCGLEMAKLSQATINRLDALYPSWQNVGNPADIWPAIMVERKASLSEVEEIAVDTLLSDPGVDAVLCILGEFMPPSEWRSLLPMVKRATKSHPDKPLVFHFYGPFGGETKTELEKTGKTLVFTSTDRAIRTLGHLADYSEFRKER
jgi:Acyl-CoA synthetase (NDP forming)